MVATKCAGVTKINIKAPDAVAYDLDDLLNRITHFSDDELPHEWQSGAQTVALDFAHAGRNVSVAIPSDVTMGMGSEIEALKMGFVPVRSLTPTSSQMKQICKLIS